MERLSLLPQRGFGIAGVVLASLLGLLVLLWGLSIPNGIVILGGILFIAGAALTAVALPIAPIVLTLPTLPVIALVLTNLGYGLLTAIIRLIMLCLVAAPALFSLRDQRSLQRRGLLAQHPFKEWFAKLTSTTQQARPVAPAGVIFCSRCGTPAAIAARFCANCGSPIGPPLPIQESGPISPAADAGTASNWATSQATRSPR